jgi:hypothetical protein
MDNSFIVMKWAVFEFNNKTNQNYNLPVPSGKFQVSAITNAIWTPMKYEQGLYHWLLRKINRASRIKF